MLEEGNPALAASGEAKTGCATGLGSRTGPELPPEHDYSPEWLGCAGWAAVAGPASAGRE